LRPAFLPLAAAPLLMRRVEKAPNLLYQQNSVASQAISSFPPICQITRNSQLLRPLEKH